MTYICIALTHTACAPPPVVRHQRRARDELTPTPHQRAPPTPHQRTPSTPHQLLLDLLIVGGLCFPAALGDAVRAAFARFDRNGSGRLDYWELREALRSARPLTVNNTVSIAARGGSAAQEGPPLPRPQPQAAVVVLRRYDVARRRRHVEAAP